MDWSGEVQQSVQAGGYVAVIRSAAVFDTEDEARTALETALGKIVSPKPGGTAPAGAAKRAGTVKWYNPTKGFGFIVPDDGESDVSSMPPSSRRLPCAADRGPGGELRGNARPQGNEPPLVSAGVAVPDIRDAWNRHPEDRRTATRGIAPSSRQRRETGFPRLQHHLATASVIPRFPPVRRRSRPRLRRGGACADLRAGSELAGDRRRATPAASARRTIFPCPG